MSTHVPCFPVKPWKSTFVSPLMRRFLIVSAYCEEPVAYCLVADLDSAERRGCRRACIVAFEAVTKAELRVRRGVANCVVSGAGFERAGSCDTCTAFPRVQLGPASRLVANVPVRARQYLVDKHRIAGTLSLRFKETSCSNPYSSRKKWGPAQNF
jgi:hypothetical protein